MEKIEKFADFFYKRLAEKEKMCDFELSTETVRCWIDEFLSLPLEDETQLNASTKKTCSCKEGPRGRTVDVEYHQICDRCGRYVNEKDIPKSVTPKEESKVDAVELSKRECTDCGTKFKSNGRCPECNPMG